MNTYEMYLADYRNKTTRAIKGRQKAINNRIKKYPLWEEKMKRGHFSDAVEALRALDQILQERETGE